MKKFSVLLIVVFFVVFACDNKKGLLPPKITVSAHDPYCDTITYSKNVVPITNATCATPHCHNAGSVNGDFTIYAGIKAKIDNGTFNNRVFVVKDMPSTGPLTADQFKILQCWFNGGAPNN